MDLIKFEGLSIKQYIKQYTSDFIFEKYKKEIDELDIGELIYEDWMSLELDGLYIMNCENPCLFWCAVKKYMKDHPYVLNEHSTVKIFKAGINNVFKYHPSGIKQFTHTYVNDKSKNTNVMYFSTKRR